VHLSETMRRPLRKSDAAEMERERRCLFERCRAHASWLSQQAASRPGFFMVADHKRRLLSTPYQSSPPGALLRVTRANGCD
jgi:hypothetical protein